MGSFLVVRTGIHPRNRERVLEYEQSELARIGAELKLASCTSPDELASAVRQADAILHPPSVRIPISRRIVESLENCQVVAAVSMGTDHIDVNACTGCGIVVTNLGGTYTEEVADHAMTLLLACSRKLMAFDDCVRNRPWQDQWLLRPGVLCLQKATLGLVAFGRIARAVARRSRAFGMRVVAYDPLVEDRVFVEQGVERCELDDLLRVSDIVSIHTPLTNRTRGMINGRALGLMRPGSILINTARGGILDEDALVKALEEGRIACAGLDVFQAEPVDRKHPLFQMKSVIVTPHIGAVSDSSAEEMRIRPISEVIRVLQGGFPRPEAFVNPEVWKNCTIQE
jgi:D-3-phosphoglycerate dehydrogenase